MLYCVYTVHSFFYLSILLCTEQKVSFVWVWIRALESVTTRWNYIVIIIMTLFIVCHPLSIVGTNESIISSGSGRDHGILISVPRLSQDICRLRSRPQHTNNSTERTFVHDKHSKYSVVVSTSDPKSLRPGHATLGLPRCL